jgi:hypothetical protein
MFEYTKKEKTKQNKNSGADGIRSTELWIKNPTPYRLSNDGLATSGWQNNIYIAIVITTVENRTIGKSVIFRHNKHLNFYRSVNIWKLILENFLNYKITKTWQKPQTRWIRKLHHFNWLSNFLLPFCIFLSGWGWWPLLTLTYRLVTADGFFSIPCHKFSLW